MQSDEGGGLGVPWPYAWWVRGASMNMSTEADGHVTAVGGGPISWTNHLRGHVQPSSCSLRGASNQLVLVLGTREQPGVEGGLEEMCECEGKGLFHRRPGDCGERVKLVQVDDEAVEDKE